MHLVDGLAHLLNIVKIPFVLKFEPYAADRSDFVLGHMTNDAFQGKWFGLTLQQYIANSLADEKGLISCYQYTDSLLAYVDQQTVFLIDPNFFLSGYLDPFQCTSIGGIVHADLPGKGLTTYGF